MRQQINTPRTQRASQSREQAINMAPDLPDEDGPSWLTFAGGSLAAHILIIALMILLPQLVGSSAPPLPYLDVTLEAPPTANPGAPGPKTPKPSMKASKTQAEPAPAPEPEPAAPEPEPEPVAEKEPEQPEELVTLKSTKPEVVKQPETVKQPEPPEPAEISTAEKEEPKEIPVLTSLKKETYKPEAAKDKALREMKEKVEKGRPGSSETAKSSASEDDKPNSVQEALARFRKNPGARPSGQASASAATGDSEEASGGGGDGGGGTPNMDRMGLLRFNYIQVVGAHVQVNWAMPERFAGTKLEAVIGFTVHRDGDISNIWFEKRSGERFFDDSAERAVKKSVPTKPFPVGLDEDSFEMIVRFTAPSN